MTRLKAHYIYLTLLQRFPFSPVKESATALQRLGVVVLYFNKVACVLEFEQKFRNFRTNFLLLAKILEFRCIVLLSGITLLSSIK